jgi:hypothetical protein
VILTNRSSSSNASVGFRQVFRAISPATVTNRLRLSDLVLFAGAFARETRSSQRHERDRGSLAERRRERRDQCSWRRSADLFTRKARQHGTG